MEFKLEFETRKAEIEEIIATFLPEEKGLQSILLEAMNYSVTAGGKRIRPMLMKECFLLCGGTNKDLLNPFMAAMEMIHTYSLVHDDLPAMDNDDYRRGKETTHKKYGEAMGILAGDGLLNYAFETASKAFFVDGDTKKAAKAMMVLSKKAGVYGMIGGQVVDVLETDQRSSKETLDFIYDLKTGALIEASMMIGAILAGASEENVLKLEQVAHKIGRAFQIQDDILDVTSTLEDLGKPILSDEKNNKTTYVTLVGLEEAKELVACYTKDAIDLLRSMDRSNAFLMELLEYLINRKN